MPFTSEEITCCTNEAAKGASKSTRNPPSCLFISSFTDSVNTPQSSNYFMAFLRSSISSFKVNKVKYLPTLTAPFPVTFLSILLHLKLNCLVIQVNCL